MSTRPRACTSTRPDERLAALHEFGTKFGRHSERTQDLREHIVTLNASMPERAHEAAVAGAVDEAESGAAAATEA